MTGVVAQRKIVRLSAASIARVERRLLTSESDCVELGVTHDRSVL